jgi:hypothetical protein
MKLKTYHLVSSPLINAGKIVIWAQHEYQFRPKKMVKLITLGWDIPTKAAQMLLAGKTGWKEENGTVIFTVPDFQKAEAN